MRLIDKLSGAVWVGLIFVATAEGQGVPAQPVLDAPAPVRPANDSAASGKNPDATVDPASLVPDLPALSPKNTALVGGTIRKLDRVRDVLIVDVFGGGKMTIAFDTRTQIFQDGAPASASELGKGNRVYVDTILNNSTVFARSIRLKSNASDGASQGVVVSYNGQNGELLVRDTLSPEPLKLHVTPQTRLLDRARGTSTTAAELVPGALVALKFGTQDSYDVASEINILALPGANFTFVGRVTGLDLRSGLLVITNTTDGKTYDIYLDSAAVAVTDKLQLASDVTVLTRFDGTRYVASSLTVN